MIELSLFNAGKPDVVIICEFGIPVGVLEVKTSSSTGGTTPLSKRKVLGQIFDYLLHLKNYTGRRDVFGILTTYHEWRIVWLPESDDSAKSKTTVATSHVQGPMAQLPSCPPNWSRVDESNQFPAPNIPRDGVEMERHVHGTGIIEWNDPNLPHILLSVLQKMKSSPMQNAVSYFRLYPKRSYIYLDKDHLRWETVDKELTPCIEGRVPPSHFQHAFLLADLGGGGDGRVWLACTRSGEVCFKVLGNKWRPAASEGETSLERSMEL